MRPAGEPGLFLHPAWGKGGAERFGITQGKLDCVSCGALAAGDEGWYLFKAGEGKNTVKCFLLPSQGDGAV